MKNSLNKMAELADRFEYKIAQDAHLMPNITPEEIQNRLVQANLENSFDRIKSSVMEFLALKNPNDMQIAGQYKPQSKSLSITVTFPNTLRQHIEGRVAQNRKSYPAFSLPTFISQEVSKLNSNIPSKVESINYS